MSGIIAPGPELEPKILLVAAKLSKQQKNAADEFVKKLLNSARAQEVFFADPNDMFYPYFLQQLTLFRADKALAEATIAAAMREKEKEATAASTRAPATETNVQTTVVATASGSIVRKGGSINEELLREIEQDAKICAEDAHPDVYTINRDHHAVQILPKHLSLMSTTAQYAAKYGPPFMEAVRRKHGEDDAFRFLRMDDPRYLIFKELELAYQTILCSTDEEVEDRLDCYQQKDRFLKVCEEKSKFLKAEIARKKAALLTDDELRRRLEWDAFSVVQTFSAKELGLEAKAAAAAAAPPSVDPGRYLAPPQAATQSFMSTSLLRPSDSVPSTHLVEENVHRYPQPPSRYPQPPQTAASAAPRYLQPPAPPAVLPNEPPAVVDGYQLRVADPSSSGHTMEYFVDPVTGMRVHVSELKDHTAAVVRDGREGEGKRPREEGPMLAHDDEYERNILRRVGQ